VLAEVVVAVLVLAVTAVLVNAAPARSVSTAPVSFTMKSKTFWVDVVVAPGSAGANDVHITALPVGGGLTTVEDMQAQLTRPGSDLPPFTIPLRTLGPGHGYAPLFAIPYAGEWQLTVRLRTGETDETVLTGRFRLR